MEQNLLQIILEKQLKLFKEFNEDFEKRSNELDNKEKISKYEQNEIDNLYKEFEEFSDYFYANDVNVWGSNLYTPMHIAELLSKEKYKPILEKALMSFDITLQQLKEEEDKRDARLDAGKPISERMQNRIVSLQKRYLFYNRLFNKKSVNLLYGDNDFLKEESNRLIQKNF